MKHLSIAAAALALSAAVAGCGGPDRASLAQQTVRTYWNNIDHGHVKQAYDMMTSGNRQTNALSDYGKSMFGFLRTTAGITAKTGATSVNDDQATVAVTLISPKTSVALHAYQHLFWENGSWKISDPNGGLSNSK